MKSILELNVDLERASKKIIDNLKNAQQETARDIWNEVVSTAPMKTGEFISSIEVSPTEKNGNEIRTTIGSKMTVTSLSGKEYNLGQLLETGTRPHKIIAVNSKVLTDGENFFGKEVNHPGTKATNFYRNALNRNKTNYKNKISKAIKEGMK